MVNERDEIGSDLVPDHLTSVHQGGFYGWPYSYFGAHVDERVRPQHPDLVARALVPARATPRGPVGVAIDREGALLVADDVGNVVWRVTPN